MAISNGNYGKYEKDGRNGKSVNEDKGKEASSKNSHCSHDSQHSQKQQPQGIIRSRGDYHNLLSYQKTVVIYEITYRFCKRFLTRGDRTVDQMIQAARSGKQNIVEGSKAASTSKETEIRLTNVARASLEELLEDYIDFLRVRDLSLWDKNSRQAQYVRKLSRTTPLSFESFRAFVETRPAEVVANIAICLVCQANYLLDKQLKGLGDNFLENGGLRERMTRARLQARKQREINPGGDR